MKAQKQVSEMQSITNIISTIPGVTVTPISKTRSEVTYFKDGEKVRRYLDIEVPSGDPVLHINPLQNVSDARGFGGIVRFLKQQVS